MAFPTLTFNDASGSDSLSSGAGPATAVNSTTESTTAAYAGAGPYTITFSGATDLSAVVATGAHVLLLQTTSGRKFFTIEGVNDGADTVTVTEAPAGTTSGLNWAIGGKLKAIDDTYADTLWHATDGAKAGWTLELEDDQTIGASKVLPNGGTTSEVINIVSNTPGTLRTITMTENDAHFDIQSAGGRQVFRDIKFANSNGSKTLAYALEFQGGVCFGSKFERCMVGDATSTMQGTLRRVSGGCSFAAYNSYFKCLDDGIEHISVASDVHLTLVDCVIEDCGGNGVSWGGDLLGAVITGCLIQGNTGKGIDMLRGGTPFIIVRNTIDGNGGDGIDISLSTSTTHRGVIFSNIISNNGGYGIDDAANYHTHLVEDWNAFYNNTSGDRTNGTLGNNSSTGTDPGFTNRAGNDFSLDTTLKAAGSPDSTETMGAGQSSTTAFMEPGAVQREEAGVGAASGVRNPLVGPVG